MSQLLTSGLGLFRLFTSQVDDRTETQDIQNTPWADGMLWPASRGMGQDGINGISQLLGDDAGNYSGSYQASAPLGHGPPGEVPYLAHNCLEYMLADTNITPLATNTTLATATRLDTSTKTLTITETAERVFESVRLVMTIRSEWAATNSIIGVRMGVKLGSGPQFDFDRSPAALSTASRNIFDVWDLDVTEYFNANFGTGTTQTCNCSIAVASTVGANINGMTFKLIVTYAFDPTSSPTRTKCIRIPIQSSISSLTTSQQELGIDGVNPSPSGQMPALDTFLPELSKTYVQYYLDLHGHDNNSAVGTSGTPVLQIDALAPVNRATIDDTIQPFLHWRDQYDMTSLGLSTAATHIISMQGDAVTTGLMSFVGGFVIVIYTYDHPSTLINNLAIYEAIVPMTQSENDYGNLQEYDSFTGAVLNVADAQRQVAVLDVQEPGTPTLVQSGIYCMAYISSSNSTFGKLAGNQTALRIYTPKTTAGPSPIILRTDGAWTLQRGINRLTLDLASTGRTAHDHAYAVINYTAGIRKDVQNGNHVINHVGHIYDSTPNATTFAVDVSRNAVNQRPPIFGTPYRISSVMLDTWVRISSNAQAFAFAIEQRQGEWDAKFSVVNLAGAVVAGVAVTQSCHRSYGLTRSVNLDNLHTGKLDITKPRRIIYGENTAGVLASWSWWITYHQHAYVVSGAVYVNGVPAPDGMTVTIVAIGPTIIDPSPGAAEVVTTTTTLGGSFSTIVPDSTRQYLALYENGTVSGVSTLGMPV